MGKVFPLVDLYPSLEPQVVSVQSDTVVLSRSEAIIWGQVQSGWGGYAEGMLEPSNSLTKHCDILVARVVCRFEQGLSPVREHHRDSEGGAVLQPWTVDTLISQFGVKGKDFFPRDMQAIRQLLHQNITAFSQGETDLTLHEINTGDAKPNKMHPRRVPLHLQQEVTDNLKQMLAIGIISPSCSPWAAPVVLVKKRHGGLRFCVDYGKLNDVTRKGAYPLPRIDDALYSLSHACWFSTLDLASGYWQVEVDRHKTAAR